MAAAAQVVRELAHVDLDPARCVPSVRAGDGDAHFRRSRGQADAASTVAVSGTGGALPPASSSHAGWNMCQSVGADEM